MISVNQNVKVKTTLLRQAKNVNTKKFIRTLILTTRKLEFAEVSEDLLETINALKPRLNQNIQHMKDQV